MRTQPECGTVAIIDDDAAVLDSLRFLLEVAGCEVTAYASAAAFLADRGARPDCIILDHHMPQMTGLELVAQLRTNGVGARIMLITGSATPAIRARAAELGIAQVMEKPPGEDELVAFIAGGG